MNAWEKRRKLSGWSGGYAEWFEGKTAFLSVVFSWLLPEAFQRAAWLKASGYNVQAGGPAVSINPVYLSSVAEIGGEVKALQHHNQNATFTTRGCIRNCKFCAVPLIEGKLRELSDSDWEPRPIICDNNLLAASMSHFNHVIDRLGDSGITGIDFNQGLDARLLTQDHVRRLSELHKTKQLKMVRLAWDHTKTEGSFRKAFNLLRNSGIPARKISVYVLIGYDDTPKDALYRLSEIWKLKAWPSPMRYQPLDAMIRNSYVGGNWSHFELQRYVRYWSNLTYLSGVPFEEFQ